MEATQRKSSGFEPGRQKCLRFPLRDVAKIVVHSGDAKKNVLHAAVKEAMGPYRLRHIKTEKVVGPYKILPGTRIKIGKGEFLIQRLVGTKLRHLQSGESYGPFDFVVGERIRLAGEEFEVLAGELSSH